MKKWKKALIGTLAFGSCMIFAGFAAGAEDEAVAEQGVTINGTDVSGKTYAEVKQIVDDMVEQARHATIKVQVGEDSVDVISSDLGLNWTNKDLAKEAVDLGNSGNAIKRYKDEKDLQQDGAALQLEFTVNENTVRSFIEEDCKQFEKEAQDAKISSDGGAGIELVPGVTGQVINVDESVKAVEDYVANEWQGQSGGSVALSVELEEPKGNDIDIESIQDCLGQYTTYYGSTVGRNTNVERGAELINGYIIEPGDTFSVCEHLVPFTAENGYELGGEYSNGQVIQGYGGGICQVSTTLYNALLLAEIEIVERHNHTMSVSYVPTSMDAAIAEGSMDLVFRNNQETPIFISGYASGGELTFAVWGKETRPSNRTVEYYSETTSTIPAPTTIKLYASADEPVGYISQVQTAAAGSTAVLYKYVYVDGVQESVEQVNTSSYEATPTSYEVGTQGASDAVLNAISTGDLSAVQAAINGVSTTTTTTGTTTDASDNTATTDANGNVISSDSTTGTTTDAYGNVISGGTTTDANGVVIDSGTTATESNTTSTDGTVIIDQSTDQSGYWTDSAEGEVWVSN